MAPHRPFTLASLLAATPAWAAGPLSRLQGVSQHARTQAEAGPNHLWAGLGIAAVVAAAIAVGALWTAKRRRG